MLSPAVASVEHFDMFRGFLAKVGKITLRLPSVSMVKTTNQKKILHNCFQATFVTIKQPGTNTELIGGHLLRKTSVPFLQHSWSKMPM